MGGFFSFFTSFFSKQSSTMNVDEFLKTNVLDLVGLADAPRDVRESFLARASEMVLEAVVSRIDKSLDADKREEFYRVFKEGAKEEEKQAFIKAYVPNFEEIVGEETGRVKIALVKAAQELKKSPA